MSAAIPQRIVSIALRPHNNHTKAFYTYVSPVTGLSYQNALKCDLKVDQPTYCLFVLDFPTTADGWTILNIVATPKSSGLAFIHGPFDLSILTSDPFLADTVYNFTICYKNSRTGDIYSEDPQEGNGPPPRGDDPTT